MLLVARFDVIQVWFFESTEAHCRVNWLNLFVLLLFEFPRANYERKPENVIEIFPSLALVILIRSVLFGSVIWQVSYVFFFGILCGCRLKLLANTTPLKLCNMLWGWEDFGYFLSRTAAKHKKCPGKGKISKKSVRIKQKYRCFTNSEKPYLGLKFSGESCKTCWNFLRWASITFPPHIPRRKLSEINKIISASWIQKNLIRISSEVFWGKLWKKSLKFSEVNNSHVPPSKKTWTSVIRLRFVTN